MTNLIEHEKCQWMDGIGPLENRPSMINTHWGGVTEDNISGGKLIRKKYLCA